MKPEKEEIYIVSVDSRGKSPSDLECYKEHVCHRDFFEEHIHDNPKNICVKSQVAGLCGLDLKLYFHEHSPYHNSEEFKKGTCPLGRTNGIATLLTFNPENGYYNHLVRGKAYVLLNDGKTELSKRQVWGLQELIREAKDLYHKDGRHYSHEARMELLTMASQYQQGTWAPHGIYEKRHHQHHPSCKNYSRMDSGLSDQATCHHGCSHVHHDGHHECCHNGLELDPYDPALEHDHHVVSRPKGRSHEEDRDHSNENKPRNYKFYSNLCH